MQRNLKIDSHKLMSHPKRVADWLDGKNIYPISMEISPSSACNHRCVFCSFDYLGYKPVFLDCNMMLENLKEIKTKGLKSVVLAGQGEPLLNPATPVLVKEMKAIDLDVAMSTNGVYFTEAFSEKYLKYFTWVRFSVNAGSAFTHQLVHKGKSNDYEAIIKHIAHAVKVKQEQKLMTTLGVQTLMIEENASEIIDLALQLKGVGVDYFTVKPYFQHPSSINSSQSHFDEKWSEHLSQELSKIADSSYQIYFRSNALKKVNKKKSYDVCRALPFWACVDAEGNVWSCLSHIGNKEYLYGNLYEKSFVEIWEGQQRMDVLARIDKMGVGHCQEACRLDEMNMYLQDICHPSGHVNFI